jgi:hypothetical protein
MLVSRRRVLLGLLVLPVGVMVGRLMMMVCGSMMVCSSLFMMLDGRVFGLVCHGLVLLKGFREKKDAWRPGLGCGQSASGRADRTDSKALWATVEAALES